MQYLRLLLFPFSLIYGAIVWVRNKCYDTGILRSREFSLPVISIGNLAVGGAGKSPMAEYIIRLMKDKYKVAVLSRGYKRQTHGFRIVEFEDTAAAVGDEPLQFKRKFKDITVAVAEKRAEGIENLQEYHDLIILDDAFQHRAVKAGMNILLFDFTRLNDFFIQLPAGNFREPFANRERADIIIVTKCSEQISADEKNRILKLIKPFEHQHLFFSYLTYGDLVSADSDSADERALTSISNQTAVFLITGIANPIPLVEKLKSYTAHINHHDYPDHHTFSPKNIIKLANEFRTSSFAEKIIITTEKDWQRLQHPALSELLAELPVYYLPVTASIHHPDNERFNILVESYASEHLQHHRIY